MTRTTKSRSDDDRLLWHVTGPGVDGLFETVGDRVVLAQPEVGWVARHTRAELRQIFHARGLAVRFVMRSPNEW